VRSVIWGGSLGGSGVVAVVEGMLLVLGDVLDEVVGALVGHVRVLLQEDGIVADLGGNLVLRVLGIDQAEGEVGMDCTGRWDFGVAICGWWWWAIGYWSRVGSEYHREG